MKKNAQENNVRKRGKNTRKEKGARKFSFSLLVKKQKKMLGKNCQKDTISKICLRKPHKKTKHSL
jgi:hypothetical protein